MNQFAMAVLIAEMRAGKRILVVSENQSCARAAMETAVDVIDTDNVRMRWANGRESIAHIDGGRLDFTSRGSSQRGRTADLVFVDCDVSFQQLDELVLVAGAAGAVVRR